MGSCLYTGHVGHQRLTPVGNAFRYSLFFLYLDLAELDQVFVGRWFWSVERSNWASFRRADHFRPASAPLDQSVRDEVERQLGRRPQGPIRLLTHLRYLGYCFNPISIYYCFAEDGQILEAFLVEIHNTPWGEEYLRALMPWQRSVMATGTCSGWTRSFMYHPSCRWISPMTGASPHREKTWQSV